jgi:hypothetical protein
MIRYPCSFSSISVGRPASSLPPPHTHKQHSLTPSVHPMIICTLKCARHHPGGMIPAPGAGLSACWGMPCTRRHRCCISRQGTSDRQHASIHMRRLASPDNSDAPNKVHTLKAFVAPGPAARGADDQDASCPLYARALSCKTRDQRAAAQRRRRRRTGAGAATRIRACSKPWPGAERLESSVPLWSGMSHQGSPNFEVGVMERRRSGQSSDLLCQSLHMLDRNDLPCRVTRLLRLERGGSEERRTVGAEPGRRR